MEYKEKEWLRKIRKQLLSFSVFKDKERERLIDLIIGEIETKLKNDR